MIAIGFVVEVLANFRMDRGESPDQWTGCAGRVIRLSGSEALVEVGQHEVWIPRRRLRAL